jgi:hypothetical protein
MKARLSVITILFLLSCGNTNIKSKRHINFYGENLQEIVKENNIYIIETYKVVLDLNNKPAWKRLEYYEIFDENGRAIMGCSPKYFKNEAPRRQGGMTLEELSHIEWFTETDIPTGQIDTAFYTYTKDGYQIKNHDGSIYSYKYDKYDNLIEKCVGSDLRETTCNYTIYDYVDGEGRIKFKIDSIGRSTIWDNERYKQRSANNNKKYEFKYDKLGNVIRDAQYEYSYDTENRLIEIQEKNDSIITERHLIKYKSGKNISTILKITLQGSTWNENTNIKTWGKEYDTTYTIYNYNEKSFKNEIKMIDKNNELMRLEKFEYKFFKNSAK